MAPVRVHVEHTMVPVKVHVEYCGGRGYAPRFYELREELKKQFMESELMVEGQVGRRGSFEVTINGEVVFSKLTQGGFPYFEDVVESIQAAQKGGVQKITKSKSAGCTVL